MIVAAFIDDAEREGLVFHDMVLPVIQIINEHIILPVQVESEVDPVIRFLGVRKGERPFSKIPLMGGKMKSSSVYLKNQPDWHKKLYTAPSQRKKRLYCISADGT